MCCKSTTELHVHIMEVLVLVETVVLIKGVVHGLASIVEQGKKAQNLDELL